MKCETAREIINKKDLCNCINNLTYGILCEIYSLSKTKEYFRKMVPIFNIDLSRYWSGDDIWYELEFASRYVYWGFVNQMREYARVMHALLGKGGLKKPNPKYKELADCIRKSQFITKYVSKKGYKIMSECLHAYSEIGVGGLDGRRALVDRIIKWHKEIINEQINFGKIQQEFWDVYMVLINIRKEKSAWKNQPTNYKQCDIYLLIDRLINKINSIQKTF